MSKHRFLVTLLLGLFLATALFAGHPMTKMRVKTDAKTAYAPGEVIVKFKQGVDMNTVNQVAAALGMQVKKHFRLLSQKRGVQYVVLRSAKKTEAMVVSLQAHPAVAHATPNFRMELDTTPNDTHFANLWGMNNTGQTGGTNDADIDAPEAWDIQTGDSGVIVGVIDTGVDYNHPDLAANMWMNAAEAGGSAGVDDDGNGYVDDIYGIDPAGYDGYTPDTDPMDGYGHGTHCSGTVAAAGNNSLGVVGVNWTAKVMALKFFDDAGGNGYNSYAIECIEYAIDQKLNYGQNIVALNASWGSSYNDPTLRDAIEEAGNAGIVFCAAAGNYGTDNETSPHYPSNYDLDTLIAVTSFDHTGNWYSGHNYGAVSVDLAAPGRSILSTVPGVMGVDGAAFSDDFESGIGNWTTGGTNNTWGVTSNTEGWWTSIPSGTSFLSDTPSGDYLANTDAWVATASDIDLSGYGTNPVGLTFYSAWMVDFWMTYDHAYVDISNDSGSTWFTLIDLASVYLYYVQWGFSMESLVIPDAYKTNHFRLRFRFVTDNTDYTSYPPYDQNVGWVIDDVKIGAPGMIYGYESWGGTSMATPHVAGAIALLAAEHPSETYMDRIARVLGGVDTHSSLTGRCVTGGRLNVNNAINGPVPVLLYVSNPYVGCTFYATDFTYINWRVLGAEIDQVKLEYSLDGGASWTDIATTDNDGSYQWYLPDVTSANAMVRVSSTGGAIQGTSGLFSIVPFSVTAGYDDWGTAVTQTADGGYVVAGFSDAYTNGGYDLLVYKVDAAGSKQWRMNYGGIRDEYSARGYYISRIIQTGDGGYLLGGTSQSFSHGEDDMILYKLNPDGSVAWYQYYGGTSNETLYSIAQTADGGYVICGRSNSYYHGSGGYFCAEPPDMLVYKVDAAGNKQWRKNLGGDEEDQAWAVQQTSDGGYIVIGHKHTWTGGPPDCVDACVYKLDSAGNKQWRKTYGGDAFGDKAFSGQQTTDGGYVIAGFSKNYTHEGPGGKDFIVYKVDAAGAKQWRKNYGGTGSEEANWIVQTADGGYAVGGSTNSYTHGSDDFLVYKLDASGAKQWRRNYGGSTQEIFYALQQTADGGYVFVGTTWSYMHTVGYADILLYKVDASGAKQWRKNYGR